MITNPIIKGFNPDPSICFHDGKYYLAVSTFEYFPGITIYESDDLVNWSYIASALSRESNLDLHNAEDSTGGIYAPTLRFYKGWFYIVTTNKNIKWNFIVKSKSIKGPWSNPILVRQNGIDPSLFFEDDKCFYISNGMIGDKKGILGGYIDVDTGKFLTEPIIMTEGISGSSTEAPHIFKRNGYYYMIFAEGGTEMGHHEEILRSKTILGPWEYKGSPILSHVNRKDYIIQATGHADFIEATNGNWYAVFLGIRKANKPNLHQLGRETFLAPITWEENWPTIGDNGYVNIDVDIPNAIQRKSDFFLIDFSKELDNYPYLKLRVPKYDCYKQDKNDKKLTLMGDIPITTPKGEPTLLAFRQTDFNSVFTAILNTGSIEGKAGIAAWYSNDYHYRLSLERQGSNTKASLFIVVHGFEAIKKSIVLEGFGDKRLSIKTTKDSYSFFVDDCYLGTASFAGLCTEAMMRMTFTGTLFAIYAEDGKATFKECIEIKTI